MSEAYNTHGRDEKCIRSFVGKPQGKRSFGKPRRRWEDDIRMYLREIGWEDVGRMHLVQEGNQWRTLVNTVIKRRI